MADFRARQRVQIHDGTDEFGVLSTKPIFTQTRGIYTVGGVDISDEANSSIKVSIVSGAGGSQYAEDTAHVSGDMGSVALVVRKDAIGSNVSADGDYATLLQDANGRLYTQIHDGGNSITVDGTVSISGDVNVTATDLDIRNLVFATDKVDVSGSSVSITGTVAVTQSGTWTVELGATTLAALESITVVATDLDIRDLTLAQDAVKVSGNSSANSETNPIFVHNVDTVISGVEVQDYNTVAAVAKDATSNHSYTVIGTTFLLHSIIVASSGAMKAELQVGPIASLVTKAVIFTSGAKPTEQIVFDPPIEVPVTATGTIRIIRRNDDNSAMDVYSTIIGTNI